MHLLCDGHGIPLAAIVTAGQRHESTQFEALMNSVAIRQPSGQMRRRPERLAADRAYDASRIRHWLRQHGIRAVIPQNQRHGVRRPGRPTTYNREHYRQRNVIERCVGWLKNARAVATRYDKLAVNYLTMCKLAFIRRYLKVLTRNTRSISDLSNTT